MGQASMPISEIDESLLDQSVKIDGFVAKVSDMSSVVVLEVYDSTGSVDCVSFSEDKYYVGQEVSLRGKVAEYEDEIQVMLS